MSAPYQKIAPGEISDFVFKREDIDDGEIDNLQRDIEQKGVVEPIIVRKDPEGDGFQGVAGYRRFLAVSQSDEVEELPAMVRNYGEEELYGVIVSETEFHERFTDNDRLRLLKQMKALGMNQEEIARTLGKSQPWVSRYLRLEDDTETIQDAVRKGDITEKQARHIRKLPEGRQKGAVKESKDRTVKQTKELVEKEEKSKAIKKLQESIEEQQGKLAEIKEAEERKEQIDERKEEVRARQKELNKKLEGEIKEKLNMVEEVQHQYYDTKQDLESAKARMEDLREQAGEIDIEEKKRERKEAIEKREHYASEVEELEEKLREARSQRDKWEEVRKEKNKAIREAKKIQRRIDEAGSEVKALKKDIRNFEEDHADQIEKFDEIKEEVEREAKDVAREKEELFEEEQELIAEGRSVQGKINNKGAVKDKLKELQTEIEALEGE